MNFTKSIIDKDAFNSKVLGQQPYVDENGELVNPKNNKKLYTIIGIIIGIILLTIIIIIVANNNAKNTKCNSIETLLKDAGYKYATDKGTLPTIIADPVTYDASELVANGYLNSTDFSIQKNVCGGTVKITNVGDGYIETVNVTGCDYCTTDTRYGTNWSSESATKPKSGIYDVVTYFNYTTKTTYHTEWTDYYRPEQLEDNPIKSYDDSRLKNIPSDAKNIIIDHDDVTYYRYRDKKWKYYKNANANYSELSCTQPSGYNTKDISTSYQTDWSDWSLEAPEEYDCIHSESKTGYRWYKVVDGNKVYWNNGAYWPTNPDEESESYTQDKKDSATVWRYYRILYRWYNGVSRGYSSYMAEPTSTYKYRDDEITTYGSWSMWSTLSSVNDSNSYYRTEITQVRTRYRLTYDEYSFNLLNNYVTKNNFASATGKTLEEIYNDQNYAVVVEYKYIYRRR